MFRILSVQSKEEQERLAAECGALYHPRCPAYALYLGERFSGLCQFMIGAGLGEIVTLDAIPGFAGDADGDAEQYLAALCRTALSFLEQIGLSRALYTGGEKSRRLMLLSGFSDREGAWSTDLKALFSHCSAELWETK